MRSFYDFVLRSLIVNYNINHYGVLTILIIIFFFFHIKYSIRDINFFSKIREFGLNIEISQEYLTQFKNKKLKII